MSEKWFHKSNILIFQPMTWLENQARDKFHTWLVLKNLLFNYIKLKYKLIHVPIVLTSIPFFSWQQRGYWNCIFKCWRVKLKIFTNIRNFLSNQFSSPNFEILILLLVILFEFKTKNTICFMKTISLWIEKIEE